ncbi:MAG: AraC family transcriptional regulator [bacterium]
MEKKPFKEILKREPFVEKYKLPNDIYYAFVNTFLCKGVVAPHYHDCLEILIPQRIKGYAFIRGKKILLIPGRVYTIAPNTVHSFLIKPHNESGVFVLQVNLDYFTRILSQFKGCEQINPAQYVSNAIVKDNKKSIELKNLLRSLSQLSQKHQSDASILYFLRTAVSDMEALYSILKILFSLNEIENITDSGEDRMKRIIDSIESLAFNNPCLENIARHSSVSKFHMCRIFKNHTGITIQTFLNEFRINRAKCLLAENGYNITQTALECGYSSVSYFIQVFSKVTGTTPKQWIMNHNETLNIDQGDGESD